MNQAIVTIDASSEVRHHCDHPGGAVTWRISAAFDGVTVYIDGSPDDLRKFASRLFDAADAHDKKVSA